MKLAVDEGDTVKAGQLIAKIEGSNHRTCMPGVSRVINQQSATAKPAPSPFKGGLGRGSDNHNVRFPE